MSKTLETLASQIEQQQKKLAQLKALKQKMEARQRTASLQQKRKQDTRRKILLGSYVLAVFDARDGEVPESIRRLRLLDNGMSFDGFLTREDDRALFGLSNPPA